jgi:hypothetical protein
MSICRQLLNETSMLLAIVTDSLKNFRSIANGI